MCLLIPCICAPITNIEPEPKSSQSEERPVEAPTIMEAKKEHEIIETTPNCALVSVEDVMVACSVAPHLKPHQIKGIQFLHQALDQNTGAILADFMGLGKTLQVLTTLYTYMMQQEKGSALILCPTICVQNWKDEFEKWFGASSAKCRWYMFNRDMVRL